MNDTARENLMKVLADYRVHASSTEQYRMRAVRFIEDAVKEEILPAIKKSLPRGYAIDEKRFEIKSNELNGEIPQNFNLRLKLIYRGKPVQSTSYTTDTIAKIQSEINPHLEELARNYGLHEIQVFSEPIVIG